MSVEDTVIKISFGSLIQLAQGKTITIPVDDRRTMELDIKIHINEPKPI